MLRFSFPFSNHLALKKLILADSVNCHVPPPGCSLSRGHARPWVDMVFRSRNFVFILQCFFAKILYKVYKKEKQGRAAVASSLFQYPSRSFHTSLVYYFWIRDHGNHEEAAFPIFFLPFQHPPLSVDFPDSLVVSAKQNI